MSSPIIDKTVKLGRNTVVWEYSKIRENVQIGDDCSLGIGVYIGPGVIIGNQVRIQNGALIYEPARIESQAFIGPNVILTNDRLPRAVDANGQRQKETNWEKFGVTICQGASIGAGSVCIGPIIIGKWSLVGAGSVVTRSIPDFALFYGNPAKFAYWIGTTGKQLIQLNVSHFECPDTGEMYRLENQNQLVKV